VLWFDASGSVSKLSDLLFNPAAPARHNTIRGTTTTTTTSTTILLTKHSYKEQKEEQ
jgi:hypothetical protein